MRAKFYVHTLLAWLSLEVVSAFDLSAKFHPRGLYAARVRRGAPKCMLPAQPEHGHYNITGGTIIDGKASFVNLQYSCDQSYVMVGEPAPFCWRGVWNVEDLPRCVPWLSLEVVSAFDLSAKFHPRGLYAARVRRGAPKCMLPAQPEHGHYNITGGTIIDGKASFVNLQYSCDQSYVMVGEPAPFCWRGVWNVEDLPRCVQACKLIKHRSVQYNCIISGSDATRTCKDVEIEGTVIQPTCNKPYYYTPIELPYMVCKQGTWNAWSTCIPECGQFIEDTASGVVPWQAGLYFKDKITSSHEHVCSATLISNSVVLSAAHCFWDEGSKKIKEESYYAVAVGKQRSIWDHPGDEPHVQKSDVKKIAVPKEYHGPDSVEGDIAVVVVSRAFDYALRVRPVCLDFKRDLLDRHLVSGSTGKVGSWESVASNEVYKTAILRIVDLPFVSKGDCATRALNDGKFCAGSANGPALCGVDSGTGATFPATIQNTTRHYLRGIATGSCRTPTTFTSIAKYQHLIKTYWFL